MKSSLGINKKYFSYYMYLPMKKAIRKVQPLCSNQNDQNL